MKIFCDYHPTKPAHWSCQKCGANLCPSCVTRRDQEGYNKGQFIHLCPKCYIPADWIGVENLIDPFWIRLPKIFAYPFYLQPLILISILSLITSFFSGAGIINALFRGAIWLMVLKYSFESLKATASGDLRPPKISPRTISQDIGQVLKQYGIYILIFLAFGYLLAASGPLIALPFLVFALFFVPSMIMLLVTTESLWHAVNPAAFIGLAFRIGWGYLLMFFFLTLLGSAPAFLGSYIMKIVPPGLQMPLIIFAECFYTIISYHLMGYVILQYHEKVGYQVDQDDFKDPSSEANEPETIDPDTPVINAINPLIQEGRLDEAISLIKEMTATQGITGIILAERFYNLLKMKKRTKEVLVHGENYIDLLIAQNDKSKALNVYFECKKANPGFLPSAANLFKLAGWLNELGKSKEAIGTYNRFVKEYPENPLAPKAFFRIAQIFHDRLMNTGNAKKILVGLKRKYPEHEIIPYVENYLANI
jgi:tetratricopeptide (TPR) repeat protein